MQASLRLLTHRKFLPLFVTQFLGAFNDNLFKTAMILFATFTVFKDPRQESSFNAIATGLFILPFFLLSALSGQLADHMDKAKIIRVVKLAEIGIMLVGGLGLLLCETFPMTGVDPDAGRGAGHGRPLDLLRPDQIRDPAPAS